MKTADIIVSQDKEVHELVDELDDLVSTKCEALGISLADTNPEDLVDPRLTQVEINFMTVVQWERAFNNGLVIAYAQRFSVHASRWADVGLTGRALCLTGYALFEGYQFASQKLFRENERSQELDEVHDSIDDYFEGLVEELDGDPNEVIVEYVRERLGEFCKQDGDGNFV